MTKVSRLTGTLNAWIEPRKSDDPALDGLSAMDRLWNQIDGAFPGTWAAKFPDERSLHNWRTVWATAFADERITPEEIGRGLAVIRRQRFAPQLPDFLAACRPILTEEEAYYEAVRQIQLRRAPQLRDGVMVTDDVWSEPAIYWAAISLESDLLNLTYQQVKARWARALDRERRNPRGPVPVYRQALPAPSQRSIAPQEQKRVIAKMMSDLGKRAPEAGGSRQRMRPQSDDDLEERKLAMQKALQELQAAKSQGGGVMA